MRSIASTAVAAASRAFAGLQSADRPGTAWSTSASRARARSAGSVTCRAVPCTTTERWLTEWWKADLASTTPSTWVTVTHTGSPSGFPAARSGREPVEPCTYRRSPRRA
ncbi:hypothetical protein GCM10027160_21530 [Streptomyces calidiresistens]